MSMDCVGKGSLSCQNKAKILVSLVLYVSI